MKSKASFERIRIFLRFSILLTLLTGICANSVLGKTTSTPSLALLDDVVRVQPYLWLVREEINEYITCENGTRRYISKDEDELPTRVHVYYHVVEYKGRVYVLYVYHWQYSTFFSVYAPGIGRIEVGNHCWDYEPVILVLDQDWTRLHAVYDAGHYDTEKIMAGRTTPGDIDLQIVKGTHAYSAEVDMAHSNVYRFPANRFIPLTIDKIFDWQKQLQTLLPYGPHDLSLLDAYLFPWTVGPDSSQIDAFSHEVSVYVWEDIYAAGGARRLLSQVYPYAECVLDEIQSIETDIFKDLSNKMLASAGLVDDVEEAINTYGVGPANVLLMDPKCAPTPTPTPTLTPTPTPVPIPSTTGGDPPIYGNITAFPTPERSVGQDLNGDGDTNDTVLRYMNLETGEVVNTGLIASGTHHAMDIYENVIVFVGGGSRIRYYDINTGTVGDTGVTGSRPSIYGNIIAFASSGTIRYFDLGTQTLVDTEVPGNSPAIYQNLIAFHAPSPQSTTGTVTLWTCDLRTGTTIDTGIIGEDATLYENLVAFQTRESLVVEDLNGDGDIHDWVIRYYDLANQTVTNTGAIGRYPALHGSRIAFATRERAVNQDLNGDGKILGNVIRYYDLETGQVVNTHKLGTEPDIYDGTISFYLWENWAAQDLNGDGDQSDPIVGALWE